MKYPITPAYLKTAPDPIARLYSDLEAFVLKDICKRLVASGEMTSSAIEQIRLLQRQGYDTKEVEEYIRKTVGMTKKQYNKVWADAVERNQVYYDGMATKAGIIPDKLNMEQMDLEIEAIRLQTLGELTNLTQSMGFAFRGADGKVQMTPITEAYQRILDDAEIQTWSGATSYNEAIKTAVKQLADSGLQWVDYESGWHNRIDVAARRAVMTGITQMSSQYSNRYMDEFGTPYMEVSAHVGARDTESGTPWSSHKAWQGKVYSIHDNDIYPSVFKVCGLGEVDGLEGANCRHMHFPWIEGVSERTYTDEQLANIDPPPIEYDGKKYTAYEATQMQRKLETAMRHQRRLMAGYQAAGLEQDATDAEIKYNRLSEKYSDFSEKAGLTEQRDRIIIAKETAPKVYTPSSVEYMARYKPVFGVDVDPQPFNGKAILSYRVTNAPYEMYAEETAMRREKSVRVHVENMRGMQDKLPDDAVVPKIVVVPFRDYGVTNEAIAGYDRELDTMFVNADYNTKGKIAEFLQTGDFASSDVNSPYLHETGHKYYYDTIGIYAEKNGVAIEAAEAYVRQVLAEYVKPFKEANRVSDFGSEYAYYQVYRGNYSELVADAFTSYNEIMRGLIKELRRLR